METLRKLIVWGLIGSMSVPWQSGTTWAADDDTRSEFNQPMAAASSPFGEEIERAFESPLVEIARNAESFAELNLDFQRNDPLLDHDPFFLRSQSWRVQKDFPADLTADEISIRERATASGVEIQLETEQGVHGVWTLDQPLTPIYSGSDHLIFIPRDKSFF